MRQCLRDGVRLTDRRQRAAIRRIAEAHVERLSDDDLGVLGYGEWLEGLEAGLAAHHAGLVPAYREAVEACFAAGLLRAVFATETLSLGINMPARTVVIERFTKYGGAGRATLTSGEYAQLTGRAGRRGLDAEGHAVVLWIARDHLRRRGPGGRRPAARPALGSFRPTYNLAVNLVRRFDRADGPGRPAPAPSPSGRPQQPQHRRRGRDTAGRPLRPAPRGPRGARLRRRLGGSPAPGTASRGIYHEADLLVAEALAADALDGAEPAVLAGVLSAVVFERAGPAGPSDPQGGRGPDDHARPAHGRRAAAHPATGPAQGAQGRGPPRGRPAGRARRAHRRCWRSWAERIAGAEEVHLVPRTRQPEPGPGRGGHRLGPGGLVRAGPRGGGRRRGRGRPGGLRAHRQAGGGPGRAGGDGGRGRQVARAAAEAVHRLVRDVVAAGGPWWPAGPRAPRVARRPPTGHRGHDGQPVRPQRG